MAVDLASAAGAAVASLKYVARLLAIVLASGAAAGVAIAVAQERDDDSQPTAPRAAPATQALPAPDAALPREPAALAEALTATTRRLRAAVGRWSGAAPV